MIIKMFFDLKCVEYRFYHLNRKYSYVVACLTPGSRLPAVSRGQVFDWRAASITTFTVADGSLGFEPLEQFTCPKGLQPKLAKHRSS